MRSPVLIYLVMLLSSLGAAAYPAYYDIPHQAEAQAEARARNLPLAWVGGNPEWLTRTDFEPGNDVDLEQMAMATLRDNAVIIFFDGSNMNPVPGMVHGQYHIHDDGPLANGAAWITPKIVFTNPEMTKTLGRVSETQMKAGRAAPIYLALQTIRDDPTAMQIPPPAPKPDPDAAPAAPVDPDTEAVGEYDTRFGKVKLPPAVVAFLNEHQDQLEPAGIVLFVLLLMMLWMRRSRS